MMEDPIVIDLYDEDKHYALLAEWWGGHDHEVIAPSMLPRPGVVVYYDAIPAASLFVYLSNSNGVGIIAFPLTNPEVPNKKSYTALAEAYRFLMAHCKTLDYSHFLTATNVPSLCKFLEKNLRFEEVADNLKLYLKWR